MGHEPRFEASMEIAFEKWDGRTLMTKVQGVFLSAEARDFCEMGLPKAPDRLVRRGRKSGPEPIRRAP